jgi:hypothetical protein
MLCSYCQLDGIVIRGHCANCRVKYQAMPMIAQAYDYVQVEKSRSAYGKWAVRYSPSTIRFFWTMQEAETWAQSYNASVQGAPLS